MNFTAWAFIAAFVLISIGGAILVWSIGAAPRPRKPPNAGGKK
jgi:hypothetical protein